MPSVLRSNEQSHEGVLGSIRNRAVVLLLSAAALSASGLHARHAEAESYASDEQHMLFDDAAAPVEPKPAQEVGSWTARERFNLNFMVSSEAFMSSLVYGKGKNPWRTIRKWGLQSDTVLHINPYDEGKTDHQTQSKYGSLSTKRGEHNKYILKLKPGMKRIGAYGIRRAYPNEDTKQQVAVKEILKPKNKTTYVDPNTGLYTYSSFNVFVARKNK